MNFTTGYTSGDWVIRQEGEGWLTLYRGVRIGPQAKSPEEAERWAEYLQGRLDKGHKLWEFAPALDRIKWAGSLDELIDFLAYMRDEASPEVTARYDTQARAMLAHKLAPVTQPAEGTLFDYFSVHTSGDFRICEIENLYHVYWRERRMGEGHRTLPEAKAWATKLETLYNEGHDLNDLEPK